MYHVSSLILAGNEPAIRMLSGQLVVVQRELPDGVTAHSCPVCGETGYYQRFVKTGDRIKPGERVCSNVYCPQTWPAPAAFRDLRDEQPAEQPATR